MDLGEPMSSEPSNQPSSGRDISPSPVRATKPVARSVIVGRRIRVGDAWAYFLAFVLGVALLAAFVGYHLTSSYRGEMAYWKARQSSVA